MNKRKIRPLWISRPQMVIYKKKLIKIEVFTFLIKQDGNFRKSWEYHQKKFIVISKSSKKTRTKGGFQYSYTPVILIDSISR